MSVFIAKHNQHQSSTNLVEPLNPASLATMAKTEDIPTYKESMDSPDQAIFCKAILIEIDKLSKLDIYELETRAPNMKVIS